MVIKLLSGVYNQQMFIHKGIIIAWSALFYSQNCFLSLIVFILYSKSIKELDIDIIMN